MKGSTSSAVSSVLDSRWRITTERNDILKESFLPVMGFREYWDFFQGNNGIATAYILRPGSEMEIARLLDLFVRHGLQTQLRLRCIS